MYSVNLSCAIAVKKGYMYFSARNYNALMRTELKTGKTEFLCNFEKELPMEGLHVKAVNFQNEIWFIPLYGKYITIYDIEKNTLDYLEVPGKELDADFCREYCIEYNDNIIVPKFIDAGWIDKEFLYLVPMGIDTLSFLDLQRRTVQPIAYEMNREELFGKGTVYQDELWIAPYKGNCFTNVNLNTYRIQKVNSGIDLGNYYGVCSYDGKLWFAPSGVKKFFSMDLVKKEFEEIQLPDLYRGTYFRDCICFQDKIWLLPYDLECILQYCPQTESFAEVRSKSQFSFHNMIAISMEESYCYVLSYADNYVAKIGRNIENIITSKITENQVWNILEKNYGNINSFIRNKASVIMEEEIGLGNFVKLLCRNR